MNVNSNIAVNHLKPNFTLPPSRRHKKTQKTFHLPPKITRVMRFRRIPCLSSNLLQYRIDVWQFLSYKEKHEKVFPEFVEREVSLLVLELIFNYKMFERGA